MITLMCLASFFPTCGLVELCETASEGLCPFILQFLCWASNSQLSSFSLSLLLVIACSSQALCPLLVCFEVQLCSCRGFRFSLLVKSHISLFVVTGKSPEEIRKTFNIKVSSDFQFVLLLIYTWTVVWRIHSPLLYSANGGMWSRVGDLAGFWWASVIALSLNV